MVSAIIRRCLDCPYILKSICLQAYEGGYDPDCRAAVGALNATCRAFHRVASNVLWSRIFSLRPLVKCLPSDVWVEEVVEVDVTATPSRSAIAITRPPDPADWERFVANAASVTSFRRFGLGPDIDDDAWCTLCLYRHGPAPFLPNLQELVWEESDADVFEYGWQLLGPKLKTVHIGQPPSDTLLLPILRSLHVKCPQLRNLSVQCRSAVGPIDPAVSRAITQLQHLETIDLMLPLFDDALLHLATLPNLSVAKIFLPRNTELDARLATTTSPIFPSLTVLHLSVIRLEPHLAALVDSIASTQLSEVRLCAAHDPPKDELRAFLAALARSPSHETLTSIQLSFPLPSGIPLMRSLNAVPPLDHPECLLDITAFQPLFSCPELTELDVTSFFLHPDDAFVRTLATACPRLQSLRLAPPYYAGRLSEVTLDGLLPLFRLCPDLTDLTLPLNATLPPPRRSLATSSPGENINANVNADIRHGWQSQLVMLDVGDSPIRAPEDVAAFLSAFCTHPDFEIVSARGVEGDSHAEHICMRERHSVLWDQVAHLVRLFARVRGEEREYWSSRSCTHS
ncbi:hypothetical protein C8Q74DRAFT_498797 [Fomes fomentarius]|nr:hypothetical protein C8Q74DRAFT_498797 [Fomes fomentarius]